MWLRSSRGRTEIQMFLFYDVEVPFCNFMLWFTTNYKLRLAIRHSRSVQQSRVVFYWPYLNRFAFRVVSCLLRRLMGLEMIWIFKVFFLRMVLWFSMLWSSRIVNSYEVSYRKILVSRGSFLFWLGIAPLWGSKVRMLIYSNIMFNASCSLCIFLSR